MMAMLHHSDHTVRDHVDIGGRRLFLDQRGAGPTVVVEVGLGFKPGTEHWGWFPIRDALQAHARVCLYDRAGYGRSDPPPAPLTLADYADDLFALLHSAALPPPYILVGGSIGGPIVWLFGARYPADVAGIVLVDSAHPAHWRRQLRLLAPAADEHEAVAAARHEVLEELDPATNEEGMDLPGSFATFAGAHLGDLPLIVLTAGKPEYAPGFPAELADQLEQDWLVLQMELAALSTNSTHVVVPDSGHCMHNDRPDVVLEAVLKLVRGVG